ncbi:MAG: hypothetical protein IJT20_06260 [Synergistaceae bacterium]|nr:hypothetical protein [Synergistaceae bacterium]
MIASNNLFYDFSHMQSLIPNIEKKGVLDYIAFNISLNGIKTSFYINNLLAGDNTPLSFLRSFDTTSFLVNDNLVLFHSTKYSSDIKYSYEYKLRNISEHDPRFLIIQNWLDKDYEQKAMEYFSLERRKDNYLSQGIWFIGFENKYTTYDCLKLYFRMFYENHEGSMLFLDEEALKIISESGITIYKKLVLEAKDYVKLGVHVYMVSWNYDKQTGETKYKIYFIITENTVNIDTLLDKIFNFMMIEQSQRQNVKKLIRQNRLFLREFSLGCDTNNMMSINIYCKPFVGGDNNDI